VTGDPLVEQRDVTAELGDGVLTLRWPEAGVTLRAVRAVVVAEGVSVESGGGGEWAVEDGDAGATRARWESGATGLSISVHLPARGPVVILEASVRASSPSVVDSIVPIDGITDVQAARRLVDGYESWSYSGVRGGDEGSSFWNACWIGDDGRVLAVQALDAERLCTRVSTEGARLRVECGASPDLVKVPGTWGYRVGRTPALGLRLAAGDVLSSGPIALAGGREPVALVEALAELAATTMRARRWSGPAPRGWESWYEYGLFVSADDVLANARVLRDRYGDRPGFDLVQLDDGWQRTYGAWWPNERFPDDLGELVGELRRLGCRPGLWIAPFRVQPDAPGIASEHPDWCIRGADGAPRLDERHGSWALDASNPGASRWIHDLGRQIRAWGFEMVKVDFCYLGAFEGGRHDRSTTGIEALRLGLRSLVDALGEDTYVLGCGMPMLPAVGLCHGNRVGHDLAMPRAHQELGHPVDEGWRGFTGIQAGARNLAARWAHAGRWYDVDPDVVMAWGADGADPAGYTTEEARTLVMLAVLCGGPFLLADALDTLDAAGRSVLEHAAVLDLLDGAPFRPVDVFERFDDPSIPEHAYARGAGIPRVWTTTRAGRAVTALFNWDDVDRSRPVPAELRGATELWTGVTVGEELVIPAHGARVLAR
jgi:hypothetical protein